MGKLQHIIKETENRINIAKAPNKAEYKKEVEKTTKDRNQRAKYLIDYDFYKTKIERDKIQSKELKDYVYNLIEATTDGLVKGQEYKIYLPVYKLYGWHYHEDVVYMIIKVIHSHNYRVRDENGIFKNQEIKEGEFLAVSCDQFSTDSSSQLIIYDVEKKEVITKHTEIKVETVQKTVEKTKIVKQEVKSGINPAKIEKAKKKILHKYKDEQWARNEDLLNDFINEISK